MASLTPENRVRVPLLRMSWQTLTLLHWPVAPERIRPLLPAGLVVDTYEGRAWVGLLPLVMADLRPLGVPGPRRVPITGPARALHTLSSTPAVNLRTYVRGPDGRDGLWFLNLGIGSRLLATGLRSAVGAPYHPGRLVVQRSEELVTYAGAWSGGAPSYRIRVRPGQPLEQTDFDVWLTGRWRASTLHLGRILENPVEHEPWSLRRAEVQTIEQDVTDSVGLTGLTGAPVVHFCDAVRHVRLGAPKVWPTR